jgi:hypothetical protein
MRWHRLTQLFAFSLTLPGCFLMHGLDDPEGEPVTRPPPPVASTCELGDRAMSVALRRDLHSTEACDDGPIEGWVVDLREDVEGFEALIDTCPPDADCDGSRRCWIEVSGSRQVPDLDRASFLYGWAQTGYARLQREVSCCRGPGCLCGVPRTVLIARVSNPDTAPPDAPPGPEELSFSRGERLCGDDACGAAPFALDAFLSGDVLTGVEETETLTVVPDETGTFATAPIHVHLVHSAHDECTDEPPVAGWLAWLDERDD